ncbi:MAG: hypothetical protein ACRCSB_00250 [Bacteroidales bacterium]
MAKNSYAQQIKAARVMAAGLKKFSEELKKRGVDAEFIQKLEDKTDKSVELNNQQESLKGELKTKTAALDKELYELHKQISEATTLIKITIPQTEWKSFGIDATR